MKNSKLNRLKERSKFYDDDVFEELENSIIEDLDLEIEKENEKIASKISVIENNICSKEVLKNIILSKFNYNIQINQI
ncbi:hypothetical protein [Aquimarina intermedia]|uniref:Uncharacterized protein n=1 Tax=Aquimarina intermedia TaxID=350814 RepID=A0A5S5BWG8_9FLAO|nr:hypothetical protein [Aquimarina intermedia]TYP71531.1 hypothetical protein BD809_109113 [Aquimarina intermedia]